jgi:hypothetical protein
MQGVGGVAGADGGAKEVGGSPPSSGPPHVPPSLQGGMWGGRGGLIARGCRRGLRNKDLLHCNSKPCKEYTKQKKVNCVA